MKVTMNVTLENHAVQYIANRSGGGSSETCDDAINGVFFAHSRLLRSLVPDMDSKIWVLLWKAWVETDDIFSSHDLSGDNSLYEQVQHKLWPDEADIPHDEYHALQIISEMNEPEQYAVIELLAMYERCCGAEYPPSLDAISLCKSML